MDDTHVLMRHEVTGGTAWFPTGAVEIWKTRGWHVVSEDAAFGQAADRPDASAPPASPKTTAAARGSENRE